MCHKKWLHALMASCNEKENTRCSYLVVYQSEIYLKIGDAIITKAYVGALRTHKTKKLDAARHPMYTGCNANCH